MKLSAILLLLFSINSVADNYVHISMFSHHVKDSYKYRQDHNLIGIEIDEKFIHSFINSQNDRSFYIGRIRRDYKCSGNWCLNYNYGILTGYDMGPYKWTPMFFPIISYDNDVKFDITIVPSVVYSIQFRFDL